MRHWAPKRTKKSARLTPLVRGGTRGPEAARGAVACFLVRPPSDGRAWPAVGFQQGQSIVCRFEGRGEGLGCYVDRDGLSIQLSFEETVSEQEGGIL